MKKQDIVTMTAILAASLAVTSPLTKERSATNGPHPSSTEFTAAPNPLTPSLLRRNNIDTIEANTANAWSLSSSSSSPSHGVAELPDRKVITYRRLAPRGVEVPETNLAPDSGKQRDSPPVRSKFEWTVVDEDSLNPEGVTYSEEYLNRLIAEQTGMAHEKIEIAELMEKLKQIQDIAITVEKKEQELRERSLDEWRKILGKDESGSDKRGSRESPQGQEGIEKENPEYLQHWVSQAKNEFLEPCTKLVERCDAEMKSFESLLKKGPNSSEINVELGKTKTAIEKLRRYLKIDEDEINMVSKKLEVGKEPFTSDQFRQAQASIMKYSYYLQVPHWKKNKQSPENTDPGHGSDDPEKP